MKLANWLGRRAAEMTMLLRDKPWIPCQIDWPYREHFVDAILPVDDDPGDISVDILEEWRAPRPPRQEWPCE